MNKRNENLTELQYYVTRESGTERPFTGPHLNEKSDGTFTCICCNTPLFASTHKYDSGSGWPSFYDTEYKMNISEHRDNSHFMIRTEVKCANCDAHLGHLFNDGPKPTVPQEIPNLALFKHEKGPFSPLTPGRRQSSSTCVSSM